MKINYNNTALEFLENPKNVSIHTPDAYQKVLSKADDYRLLYGLQNQFSVSTFEQCFKTNVQYITQPFYNAYLMAQDKLRKIALSVVIDDAGTLIIPWPNHTQTIFYRVKTNGKQGDEWLYEVFFIMFTKTPRNDSFALDVAIYLNKQGEDREAMDYVYKGFFDQGRDIAYWCAEIILMKSFLQFADVETKVIKAEKKDHHVGVKYVNETKRNIEILDSTYFTTICREEGFGVRGHFRFQPYGPGMSLRRLQWISDFQKTGYHREAKILKLDE